MLDLIIRCAEIQDGNGSVPFIADIGVNDDTIVEIGDLSGAMAGQKIDASGLVAAPGFIDMHSHSDFTLPINPNALSKIHQGVTTEVIGQCGVSPAPSERKSGVSLIESYPHLTWEWSSFGSYLDYLHNQGISVNIVPLVGHGSIRRLVMGETDHEPSCDEINSMRHAIHQAMEEGAWGMSTGLIYPPGMYAKTMELIDLCRTVVDEGGFYFSHIRGEGPTLLDAVSEAIKIGEEAIIPVQISHLKASWQENWHLMDGAIKLIDCARQKGLDVTADVYPYTACHTDLSIVLPPWAHDGGSERMIERLKQKDERKRMLPHLSSRQSQWGLIMISFAPDCPELEGQTVAEITEKRGADPLETVMDIIIEGGPRTSAVYYDMKPENLKTALLHPEVMIGSDGQALAPFGPLRVGRVHPRSFGAFPRLLAKYVREEGLLSLPEAVKKMSGLPAARLGLSDRGRIARGKKADIVVFNPNTVQDMATFLDPYRYPTGIEYVFVNGQAVVTPKGHTGKRPGRILNRP